MAIPAWSPCEACSDMAQLAASPAATTVPPIASPKVRSRFSSSSRLSYAPNSTAMNSAAAASSSSRDTSAAPVLVWSTSPSSVRSKTSPTSPERVYEPRRSSSASVAAVSASHPETTSRCTARTPEPRCQQARTKAAPPTMTTNPAYATYRPKPYNRPTGPSSAAWAVTGTEVSEGAPMEKVKAPATGWLSADTTW